MRIKPVYFRKAAWGGRALFYGLFTKVGFPSYIGKPLYVSRLSGLKIGTRVGIYPGMRAEIVTGDAAIQIGDNTSIGQNFHVVSYGDALIIGEDVTISGNVFITNCDHQYTDIGKHVLNQPIIMRHTIIGDNCFIGYGAVIMAGTVLGRQCIVGSNAVVKGVFPDYSVIVGSPARIVKKYNANSEAWERTI